jgi:hypothetical protein
VKRREQETSERFDIESDARDLPNELLESLAMMHAPFKDDFEEEKLY